jgi:hypothetical protein
MMDPKPATQSATSGPRSRTFPGELAISVSLPMSAEDLRTDIQPGATVVFSPSEASHSSSRFENGIELMSQFNVQRSFADSTRILSEATREF